MYLRSVGEVPVDPQIGTRLQAGRHADENQGAVGALALFAATERFAPNIE